MPIAIPARMPAIASGPSTGNTERSRLPSEWSRRPSRIACGLHHHALEQVAHDRPDGEHECELDRAYRAGEDRARQERDGHEQDQCRTDQKGELVAIDREDPLEHPTY